MLRPQDTSTRGRKNLNGLWAFTLDTEGTGTSEAWFAGPLPGAGEMAVPASYNDIAADAAVRDFIGNAWYQRTVWVPRGWPVDALCCTWSRRPIGQRSGWTTPR